MNLGIIIPARLSSKRLPKKVLLRYKGKTVLEYVIDIAKKINHKKKIIVSISCSKKDDKLENFLKRKKIKFYRGDLNNVSKRFLDTINFYSFDTVIRLNGDSPLHNPSILNYGLRLFKKKKAKFVTNIFKRTFPKGMSVEIINANFYRTVYSKIKSKQDKSNITSIIYRKKKNYKVLSFMNDKNFSNINLCVDNFDDFKFFKFFIKKYGRINITKSYKSYLNILEKINF